MIESYKSSKFYSVLKKAFPSYRKQSILTYALGEDRKVKYSPSHWDGGSIDYHFLVSSTGDKKDLSFQSWPNLSQREIDVLPGFLFVTAGRSGGKDSSIVVYH